MYNSPHVQDAKQVEFEERAGVLEFDSGLPRKIAEAQAAAEIGMARRPGGVIGELIAAGRVRSRLASILSDFDLEEVRAPLWGFGHVIAEGAAYRPAAADEPAHPAVIAPAGEAGLITDLVAQDLITGRLLTRLGVAAVLGANEVDAAREAGRPVLLFRDALSWLRGNCRGAVVVDWSRARDALDGVLSLHCHRSIAGLAHRATRRCWPVPRIMVPQQAEARRAA